MGYIGNIFATINCLKSIETLREKSSFLEIVEAVRADSDHFIPPWPNGIRDVVNNLSLLKRFHSGLRKNPCLYLSMLVIAEELKAERPIEVNVGISAEDINTTTGHCWISRDGSEIYPFDDLPVKSPDWEELARKGDIVYWWSKSKESPLVVPIPEKALFKRLRSRKCRI